MEFLAVPPDKLQSTAVLGSILAIHALIGLFHAFKHARKFGVSRFASQWLLTVKSLVRAGSDEADDMGRMASRQMEETRTELFRRTMRYSRIFAISCCAAIVLSRAVNFAQELQGQQLLTLGQDALLLFALLWHTALRIMPGLGRLMDANYALGSLFCTLWIVLGPRTYQGVLDSGYQVQLLRLLWSAGYLKVRTVAFWNALHLCCILYISIVSADSDGLKVPMSHLFIREVGAFLLMMAAIDMLQKCLLSREWHALRAKASQNEQLAARYLLNIMCNVVIELDHEHKFHQDAPGLASLLMLSSNTSMQGMQLDSFMPSDDDKTRFTEFLVSDSGGAGAVNVKFQDSVGGGVEVEMFKIQFEAIGGCKHHLIGLREVTDVPAIAELRSESQNDSRLRSRGSEASSDSMSTGCRLSDLEELSSQASGTSRTTGNAMPRQGTGSDSASTGSIRDLQTGRNERLRSQIAQHGRRLVFPRCKASTIQARDASIVSAISMWNLEIPRCNCCAFHTHINQVKRCARRLGEWECIENFPFHVPGELQCQSCGTFADIADFQDLSQYSCFACGHDVYELADKDVMSL
eukprot:gb/GFBE01020156.1/.p1 GENE.gb/GFBE01020156.1/~~gb/GFBE01020156.1/.p1  ORF type:complete len:579 (+),score=83.44 gb/GFBE01020156.1/:1-1737(+)